MLPAASARRTVAFGNSFNDDERCVLAGYDNGDVKMFDLRMNKVRERRGDFRLLSLNVAGRDFAMHAASLQLCMGQLV